MTRINLTDDADLIAKKIKKAKTDPEALPDNEDGLEGRAEASNLVGIYASLSDQSKADVLKEFGGKQFSEFKPALIELSVEKLAPITTEMSKLLDDPAQIDKALKEGSEKASSIAEPVYQEVLDIMGFWK